MLHNHITLQIFTHCVGCQSDYHVMVTPNFLASSSASCLCPESFTAFTTVAHVRGRSPVLSSLLTHLVTRSSIRSVDFLLSVSIWSISVESKRRLLPKCLQSALTWFPSASVISVSYTHLTLPTIYSV